MPPTISPDPAIKQKSRRDLYKEMLTAAEAEAAKPKPPPEPPFDLEKVRQISGQVAFKLTGSEQKRLDTLQEGWQRCAALIEASTQIKARATYLAEQGQCVAAVLAGKDFAPRSQEEIKRAFEQRMRSAKHAAATVAAQARPLTAEIWTRWALLAEKFGQEAEQRERAMLGASPTKAICDAQVKHVRRRFTGTPHETNWSASPHRQLDGLL